MKAPSTALLRAFSPLSTSEAVPWMARGCLAQQQPQQAQFSTTDQRMARKKGGGPKTDMRIKLERQYNSMASACEALRLLDSHGLTAGEREKLGGGMEAEGGGEGRDVGRLYRIAMKKDEVWKGAPIEYARIQTETPGREGWNSGWTR
ncbi:hypothetical protein LTR78_001048 [Recurvomyces mirabilis]|uniref:Uncharacterized protein n=1 Tax=Recurvomyces mirabilis TaxID=574656 RepID=A0AAE0WWA2_9PEZI|nr:hypothetical protein LTR78_001048 [Recurvomyces mirabilis]KAK5159020.1 hypothetical protein LTS14_003128 [Recurvomyces mirabilis]